MKKQALESGKLLLNIFRIYRQYMKKEKNTKKIRFKHANHRRKCTRPIKIQKDPKKPSIVREYRGVFKSRVLG